MTTPRRWLALAVCIVLVISCAPAAQAAKLNIPVTYYKLPNGLKVVISEDHTAPVVTVAVYYGVGFRIEPKGRTGFAHLFEHMMFQGSGNVKKFEHAKFVEANGGTLNGQTSYDRTNYFETLPSNAVNVALWLEADRMRSLDISAVNLKNQQNVVSEEVRVNVLNQPYALFEWLDMWQQANQNWNNAHNFYGDLTEIEAANLQDVRDFFKTYYAPNNAVVTVVGDVDTAEVRKMIEQDFAGIPAQPDPPRPDISEPPQTKERRVQQSDKLANLPALAIGYHLPAQDSPDFAPTILLNLILQGDDSSRLYQKLVKEKEMCLDWTGGVQASVSNEWDYNGPMLLTSRSTYKAGVKVDDILREADAVVAGVQQQGVTDKELADAKVRFRSNFYDTVEDTFGKAHILSLLALFHDDPAGINRQLDRYEAVTPEQVKAVANKYLVAANRTILDRVPEAKGGK